MNATNLPFKIILTGPESSGKTTLAGDLARALDTFLTPEFARPYLAYLGRQYVYEDLKTILSGQKAWETWYAARSTKNLLVCDTDWTVIRIWESYKYGATLVTAAEQAAANTHYFLCAPEIPWQPDALREHPEERDQLFALYQQLLQDIHAGFTILRGNPATRLETALSVIRKFC